MHLCAESLRYHFRVNFLAEKWLKRFFNDFIFSLLFFVGVVDMQVSAYRRAMQTPMLDRMAEDLVNICDFMLVMQLK